MTKEFLKHTLELDEIIAAKMEQLTSLKAAAEKTTTTLSNIPGGGSCEHGAVENYCIKISELSNEIYEDTCRLNKMREEILDYLFKEIPSAQMRRLLTLRYIDGRSFNEISELMNYTPGWIRRRINVFLKGLN